MLRRILIGLAIVSTAAGKTEITPYVSLGGGYSILRDSTIKAMSVEVVDVSFDNGYIIEAAAGLVWNKGLDSLPVRTE